MCKYFGHYKFCILLLLRDKPEWELSGGGGREMHSEEQEAQTQGRGNTYYNAIYFWRILQGFLLQFGSPTLIQVDLDETLNNLAR